jgi:hypothetical protein
VEIGTQELPFAAAQERLHEQARGMTGLADFGDPEYLEGLRHWLRSLDVDAELSAAGRRMTLGMTLTALAGRLESEASLAAHPEVRRARLERPLVILGLPRTGTTVLHRMLCRDPRNQGLELWLGHSPQPRPPRVDWDGTPAFQRCQKLQEVAQRLTPAMARIHAMAADTPDECWNLLRQSFRTVTFECSARVSGYARWWSTCDMRKAYARFTDNLRLIGSNDRHRRWVLKDPSHLFAPEALLEALPEALVVMTHRDPAKSIPSVCSLTALARRQNDRVFDAAVLGAEQNALWIRGLERTLALRRREPERFVDIHFDAIREDPLAVIREIYARAGLPEDAAAEAAIREFVEAHPTKAHHYTAEEYGLSSASIRERYESYIEQAGVRLED